jgi:hypothetical protein
MNASNMNNTDTAPSQSLPQTVRLTFSTLFSIFIVPSLLCFLLNFYCLIRFRVELIYKKLQHHAISCLLISDFLLVVTQVPFTLINLYTGSIPKISRLCEFWIYCTYTLFCVSDFLTMCASIQRYLFVFHKNFYMKWKTLTHYSALFFCCLYPPSYYLYFNFFYPCVNNYDYTQGLCGQACFAYVTIPVMIDYVGNILLPVSTIVVVNCMLLTKVILQKRRMASNNNTSALASRSVWKKNRRIIVQLMIIALATSLAWLPFVIGAIMLTLGSTLIAGNILALLNFLPYFNCMLTPFLAIVTLPKEVTEVLFHWVPCCRRGRGGMATATVSPTERLAPTNIQLRHTTVNDNKLATKLAVD